MGSADEGENTPETEWMLAMKARKSQHKRWWGNIRRDEGKGRKDRLAGEKRL